MSMHPKKARKWGDTCAQQPIRVTNKRTGFLAVWKQHNEFQQIKQHRAIFVWMKNNKDFMKVRRKQSYNKHLIRRLTSQYGWVFLLVELYFGSPKGSPKYCWLVKYPAILAGQPSNKIYLITTSLSTVRSITYNFIDIHVQHSGWGFLSFYRLFAAINWLDSKSVALVSL